MLLTSETELPPPLVLTCEVGPAPPPVVLTWDVPGTEFTCEVVPAAPPAEGPAEVPAGVLWVAMHTQLLPGCGGAAGAEVSAIGRWELRQSKAHNQHPVAAMHYQPCTEPAYPVPGRASLTWGVLVGISWPLM